MLHLQVYRRGVGDRTQAIVMQVNVMNTIYYGNITDITYRQNGINPADNYLLMPLDLGPLQLSVGHKLTDSHCSFSFLLALYKDLTKECPLA